MAGEQSRVSKFEIVGAVFALGTEEDIPVRHALNPLGSVEVQVEDVFDVLHIHGEAFQPVGHFKARQNDRNAADLLEIGELADLHAVAPDLPADAPGAEGRTFPIILDEAKVVQQRIEADFAIAGQEELLRIGGLGFMMTWY